jgi:hypothetical protein
MDPFGRWIKERRISKRLGLWRCAGYSGIGGEALRLIETGRTNPANCKASTLYGLARILELDPMEVIERAIRQDEELMRRLSFGERWKTEEREDSRASYERYETKRNARAAASQTA